MDLKPHPIAEMLPPLPEAGYEQLKTDIAENGLRDPISVWIDREEQAWIVDGLNRWKICHELDIVPETERWDFGGDSDVAKFVISRNLHRRHLDESQRGMLAARLEKFYTPAAKERQRQSKGPGEKGTANLQHLNDTGTALAEAAEQVNVSTRMAGTSKALMDMGCEELIALVDAGKIKVSPAELVARTLTPDDQRELVAKGPAAVKKKAAKIRAQKKKQKDAKDALAEAEAKAGATPVEAAPIEDPGIDDEPEPEPRREIVLGGNKPAGKDSIAPVVEPEIGEFTCPHCGAEIAYQSLIDYMSTVTARAS